MRLFKITFEIKTESEENTLLNAKSGDEEDLWDTGFYYVDGSINTVQQYIHELCEGYEVRNIEVLTAEIPGWSRVPTERKSEV